MKVATRWSQHCEGLTGESFFTLFAEAPIHTSMKDMGRLTMIDPTRKSRNVTVVVPRK